MACVRRDFSQRLEHKPPFVQPRMRNSQRWDLNYRTAKQKDININCPRPFLLLALSAHALFQIENCRDQLPRHLLRLKLNDTIQEPRLCGQLDGFGLIERRYRSHLTEISQLGDRS